MENNYFGIYAVLASLPIWATITIFYLLTLFVVDAGREYFEGFSYNVSHAARYGDVGLLVIVIIGATVLQRNPELGGFIATDVFQFACLFLFALICYFMIKVEFEMRARHVVRQVVDIYHNVFIIPFIASLILAVVPVIFSHGTMTERWVTTFCLFLWTGLLLYDLKNYRLDQRSWLKAHGYTCILKN